MDNPRHLTIVPDPLDGQPHPSRPPVIARDLTKLRNVAREIARVYRAMRRGQIASQEGTRAVYVLGKLADVLELTEIERRLEELEQQLTGGHHHER